MPAVLAVNGKGWPRQPQKTPLRSLAKSDNVIGSGEKKFSREWWEKSQGVSVIVKNSINSGGKQFSTDSKWVSQSKRISRFSSKCQSLQSWNPWRKDSNKTRRSSSFFLLFDKTKSWRKWKQKFCASFLFFLLCCKNSSFYKTEKFMGFTCAQKTSISWLILVPFYWRIKYRAKETPTSDSPQKRKTSGPVHTGRESTCACKFACKPFDVACKLCEHSHWL